PRAGRFLFCIAAVGAVVLVVVPPAGVAGHTRGVRPGQAAGRPFPENATRAEELERLFMRWVRYVGGLKHSTFHHAPLARAFPSYSLVVNKDPAAGDFTSVQAAVDSLPTINLVRVVIKVNAGTYTEKVTISSMRAFITLEGAGADKTIVQWGDTADTPAGPRGRPLGTYGSASFAVNAQYFIARNITFKVHTLALAEHGAGAECGGDGEAGGGAAGVGGQRGVRGVPVPGRAGHALRPVGAPLLQGLLHRGVHRLHLRQRALPLRGLPRARDRAGLRGADGAEPAELAGGRTRGSRSSTAG
uniref:pectinesterase n=1 Tax=Aegilops tauschii subsp. strangulata TaxID=200361 RepID=A0A453AKP7_AEGTS